MKLPRNQVIILMNNINLLNRNNNSISFLASELNWVLQSTGAQALDHECIRKFLIRLHNGVEPDEETVDLFFSNGNDTITIEEAERILKGRVPFPDVTIKPNLIFPEEQTRITPFKEPDISNAQYNYSDTISEKSDMLLKQHKTLFGLGKHNRFCVVNNTGFIMYESKTKEKETKRFALEEISGVEELEMEKNLYPFKVCAGEKDSILYCNDEVARKDWMTAISTFCVLEMLSSNRIVDEQFKGFIESGANVNAYHGRHDPRTLLYYLYQYQRSDLGEWLLQHKANPSCLLRWEFVVKDHVLTSSQILEIFQKNNISLGIRSDDGFRFNILHYSCYFGIVKDVEKLVYGTDCLSLVNSLTERDDIALTIALLSPVSTEEEKVHIANLLVVNSNYTACNHSFQNPIQLTILKGHIGLLFKMLQCVIAVRYDQFKNSILHLAIKAGLSSAARYILRYNNTIMYDDEDSLGDTPLVLAIKAGEEELACEILSKGANSIRSSRNWNMEGSQNDNTIHQALKRDMQRLANEICDHDGDFLTKDTVGDLPIHIALGRHLDQSINYFLNHPSLQAFINEANMRDNDTPIHLALKLGYFNHSHALIAKGANINARNRFGYTAAHILMKVARGDFMASSKATMTPEEIVTLMEEILANHPDLEVLSEGSSDGGCETCLHMAINGGNALTQQLAVMCLNYDNNLVTLRNSNQATPLICAVEKGNMELVRALVEAGSDLNAMNSDRDTCLHIATNQKDAEIVNYLIQQTAYSRIWNADGLCPLHLAVEQNNVQLLSILCLNSIDANLRTRNGSTPFMIACEKNSYECGCYLIRRNADPYMLNNENKSCLSILATAIRSSIDSSTFANLAKEVFSFSSTYYNDCFGDKSMIDQDTSALQECIDSAMQNGLPDLQNGERLIPNSYGEAQPQEVYNPEVYQHPVAVVAPESREMNEAMPSMSVYDDDASDWKQPAQVMYQDLAEPPQPYSEPPVDNTERIAEAQATRSEILSAIQDCKTELETIEREESQKLTKDEEYMRANKDKFTETDAARQIISQSIRKLIETKNMDVNEATNVSLSLFVDHIVHQRRERIKKEYAPQKEAIRARMMSLQGEQQTIEDSLHDLGVEL